MSEAASYSIYGICSVQTNKVYVGRTKNVKTRIAEHFKRLAYGTHEIHLLQGEYQKFGRENFKTAVLVSDINNKKKLNKAEMKWISHYRNQGRSLNILSGGSRHREWEERKTAKGLYAELDSTRELAVYKAIKDKKPYKDIALEFNISPLTVSDIKSKYLIREIKEQLNISPSTSINKLSSMLGFRPSDVKRMMSRI